MHPKKKKKTKNLKLAFWSEGGEVEQQQQHIHAGRDEEDWASEQVRHTLLEGPPTIYSDYKARDSDSYMYHKSV